jgi:hypothetical protein
LKRNSQVVVFITPHIVDAQNPNLTDGDVVRRPLPPVGEVFQVELEQILAKARGGTNADKIEVE